MTGFPGREMSRPGGPGKRTFSRGWWEGPGSRQSGWRHSLVNMLNALDHTCYSGKFYGACALPRWKSYPQQTCTRAHMCTHVTVSDRHM